METLVRLCHISEECDNDNPPWSALPREHKNLFWWDLATSHFILQSRRTIIKCTRMLMMEGSAKCWYISKCPGGQMNCKDSSLCSFHLLSSHFILQSDRTVIQCTRMAAWMRGNTAKSIDSWTRPWVVGRLVALAVSFHFTWEIHFHGTYLSWIHASHQILQ
jgi:hypothetical protein